MQSICNEDILLFLCRMSIFGRPMFIVQLNKFRNVCIQTLCLIMLKAIRWGIKCVFHSFIIMIIRVQRQVPNTNGINEFQTLAGTDVHLWHLQMYLYKQNSVQILHCKTIKGHDFGLLPQCKLSSSPT